jgi:peptidoglycan/xylan/chitin deacetylase (PgdA/CDA1 family)
MDDVGASSKRYEVYGITRIAGVPFPGNALFLKYLPPIKRWGPYRELRAAELAAVLDRLGRLGARLTVAVTAGWVEWDGAVTPYPVKFAEAARVLRDGARAGLIEVANHGYTHCVLQDLRFRPRWWRGNRAEHREFHDWLPESVHREHLARSQDIHQQFLGEPVLTLVPPGNLLSRKTLAVAPATGIRYVSCLGAGKWAPAAGLVLVDDAEVEAFHDRDLVHHGVTFLDRLLAGAAPGSFVTVRELAGAGRGIGSR